MRKRKKKEHSFDSVLADYYRFAKGFLNDFFDSKLGFYAASMSWSTLFFIIPFMVILLVLFTHLPIFYEAYHKLHELIAKNLVPSDSDSIMNHIDTFVANADKLGFIGLIYVLFASLLFFRDYDFIVNDIFNTPQRKLLQIIKTYFGMMLFMPVMFGVSFWLTSEIQHYLEVFGMASILHIYLVLPYLIIWGIFYLTYQISPQTSVSVYSALFSSFITSLIWYIAKSIFIFYVIHNRTYSVIYGGVSTFLFFFLWIYISWIIFLYGLKFCYILDKDEDDECEVS
jgi:membrane protein